MDNRSFYASLDKEERLDILLKKTFPELSRAYLQKLIQEGYVQVNQKQLSKNALVSDGAEIHIQFYNHPDQELLKENIPLEVLYEDEDVLCINKKAGMVVHPGAGNTSNTLVNALIYHRHNLPCTEENKNRPGIVHRLDKETSGVMVVAKTKKAYDFLIEQFKERLIEKEYLAIAQGLVESETISLPIKRSLRKRQKMVAGLNGKEAVSIIEPLEHLKEASFIKIKPITGRTHQIRVHLASCNHPVWGDVLYGFPLKKCFKKSGRQIYLHAHKLSFRSPSSKKTISVTAPIPKEFALLQKKLYSSS